ncbi:MAG: ATP-binding protein [Candidatus Omnitrophota bacterium]
MEDIKHEDKKHKILIVEDSEIITVILRHILKKEGWHVLSSSNIDEALISLSALHAEEMPDLIIIDYHIPDGQANALCRRLKMNVYTRCIPVLMLTMENGLEHNALESGADDYLPQFANDDVLIHRIKLLLGKSEKRHGLFNIASPLFHKSRILAVDCNIDYLNFLENAFQEDGLIIDIATNSKDAIAKITGEEQGIYDCILLGQITSEIDSIELCKRILEIRRTMENPPLIFMLMKYETRDEMSRSLEAGADDFVGKPSDIFIIKARLVALLWRKFIQEENRRIFEELKRKELEVERSRMEQLATEAKAILAEKLLITVERLEQEVEERRHMERQIKNYSLELERSNKELEAFAYVASHDLQEPLRAISSYLQLVEKRYKDKIDDKGKDFISRAVGGARRMQEMISDLLIYSRITTHAKSFERYSFESIMDRTLTNLSASIERTKAIVTRDPMPELVCDESQILRLFQNLISNAIKFCEKTPPVIHISAQPHPTDNDWLFSVKDNGIGIEPEHKDHIFKIFNRLHGRGKYPGTGIGLAICQKIVERHGGKIWVESTVGEGSNFLFTLPRMTDDTNEKPRESVKESLTLYE